MSSARNNEGAKIRNGVARSYRACDGIKESFVFRCKAIAAG